MTSRQQDPQGYDRQRRWHIDRARTRKVAAEGTRMFTSGMAPSALWDYGERSLRSLVADLADDRHPERLRAAQDALACLEELRLRGQQLSLPLD